MIIPSNLIELLDQRDDVNEYALWIYSIVNNKYTVLLKWQSYFYMGYIITDSFNLILLMIIFSWL